MVEDVHARIRMMEERKDVGGINLLLSDPRWEVRLAAADAIARLAVYKAGDASSVPLLTRCLYDTSEAVRSTAAYALGRLAVIGIGSGVSILPLRKCLADRNTLVRGNAVVALAALAVHLKIGDKAEAIETLNRWLRNSDNTMRADACMRIGWIACELRFGDASTIPLLTECLKGPDDNLNEMAAFALHSLAMLGIADRSAIPVLEAYLKNHPNSIHGRNALDSVRQVVDNAKNQQIRV
ncbi:MAG: HEAT repeat domain-containing protein [Thermoplasmata archaeon]|nr:HEAT repeat domain-containing protein [Thermoplasmata archaeon]